MLKVNKEHKKIDLSNLNLTNVKKKVISAGTVSLAMLMLSGCTKKDNVVEEPTEVTYESTAEEELIIPESHDIIEHNKNEIIKIPFMYGVSFDDDRVILDDEYTYDDLNHINSCILIMDDGDNFDFLNYMVNLESISICDYCTGSNNLSSIDGRRFKNPLYIRITSSTTLYGGSFSEARYGFLKDIKCIDSLSLGTMDLDSSFLESLSNVRELEIELDKTSNYHCHDLSNFKSVIIDGKPYDVAMYINNNDIENMKSKGVDIYYADMDTLTMINNRIDEIVNNLNISKDADEQEKLNAILTYVLENLEYDEKVSELLANNNVDMVDSSDFYLDGYMYGALNKDSQICGNYASLTTALSHAVGLDTYFLISSNHSWNAVKIGDNYYYVDSTALDAQKLYTTNISNEEYDSQGRVVSRSYNTKEIAASEIFRSEDQDEINKLKWYLEDPAEVIDDELGTHQLLYTPVGLTIRDLSDVSENISVSTDDIYSLDSYNVKFNDEIRDEEDILDRESIPDISNKRYEVTLNGKKHIVGGPALIGILIGTGMAITIGGIKRRKNHIRKISADEEYYDIEVKKR